MLAVYGRWAGHKTEIDDEVAVPDEMAIKSRLTAKTRAAMLNDLNTDQARFVALLAKAARAERDAMLGHGPDRPLSEGTASRGERNPTAALGYDPLPPENLQLQALRDALGSLTETARSELYVLMRVGQGQVAAKQWHRGLQEAQLLGDATVSSALIEDPDLHEHVLKGLYEADRAG